MNDKQTPAASAGQLADTVRALERELRHRTLRLWLQRLGVVAALGLAAGGYSLWRTAGQPPPEPEFTSKRVERRDVFEEVQSTGTVKPVTEVQVGAQVSGRIVKVHADFNARVKKGDLLAEIDPSLFGAQVSQVGAQLSAAKAARERAQAQLATTRLNAERAERLLTEGLGSQSELDQARGSRAVAEADVAAAEAQIVQLGAQLNSAQTTLAYARIYSPIDGIVVSRSVEPGQTVAASFSAPVLFVIAQDLQKMQVLADIDEADVGKLVEGLKAAVVVDAFPGEKFQGKLSQLRYSPNNVLGVVTYSAVIDVENPALKLRPGMTATVTIRTREAKQVLAVPNAALRFRPLPPGDDGAKATAAASASAAGPPLEPLAHGQGRVYVPRGGEPGQETVEPRVVELGLTDGVWTELRKGPVEVGTEVVTEQRKRKAQGGFFFR